MKIYYTIPYNSDFNIGKYYNDFFNIIPNDDDYGCIVDADTIFTTPDYGTLIENVIARYPDVEAFTCYTNRVGCPWQVYNGVDVKSNDIEYHRNIGKKLYEENGTDCVDMTNTQLFSGMFFIIKKSAWKKIGGAIEKGMLKVDNAIHQGIKNNGMKLFLMKGLYLYHWYRNGNKNDKAHLTPKKETTKQTIPLKEEVTNIQNVKQTNTNKKVIYTCITGGYDKLIDPTYVTEDFDYICFTDNPMLTSKVWKFKTIPQELKELSTVKQQRAIKINPHLFLSEYDISIWIDGNILAKGDLNEFVNNTLKDDCSMYFKKHPIRTCIYQELNKCIELKKDTRENAQPQIDRYIAEGFPSNFGLQETNVILRKHNEQDCVNLMNAWWAELKKGSHRDQLSLNYCMWKLNSKIENMSPRMDKSVYFNKIAPHVKPKDRIINKPITKSNDSKLGINMAKGYLSSY